MTIRRKSTFRIKASQLPKTITVLDIETSDTIRRNSRHTPKLALVGIKTFYQKKNRYIPGRYLAFTRDQIEEVPKILSKVSGPILGHNILGFDYQVLDAFFPVKTFIPRTLDTLFFLSRKTGGKLNGLSLDALAKHNLRKRKLLSGKQIPLLLKQGEIRDVLLYNERDLDLTFAIWKHLCRFGHVMTYTQDIFSKEANKKQIKLDKKDQQLVIGRVSTCSNEYWDQMTRRGANFFNQKISLPTNKRTFEYLYQYFHCESCNVTHIFRATICKNAAPKPDEKAFCAHCTRPIGTLQIGHSCEIYMITKGPAGFGVFNYEVPTVFKNEIEQKLARELKKLVRPFLFEKPATEKQCAICRIELTNETISPRASNTSRVCAPCDSSGVWSIFYNLKQKCSNEDDLSTLISQL